MDNILFENLEQLEKQLENINPHCVLSVSMKANSLGELQHTLKLKQQRYAISLVLPFNDGPFQEHFYFKYQMRKRPNITITITADKTQPVKLKFKK